MKKASSKPLTTTQEVELSALAALSEAQINTAAVPNKKIRAAHGAGVFSSHQKATDLAP